MTEYRVKSYLQDKDHKYLYYIQKKGWFFWGCLKYKTYHGSCQMNNKEYCYETEQNAQDMINYLRRQDEKKEK